MKGQDVLFDPQAPIDRVTQPRFGHHHRDAGPTEMAAARSQVKKGAPHRVQILRAIVAAGTHGLTRNEIADRELIFLPTVCGRVKELLDARFIEVTTRVREGRGVLVATERGRRRCS